MQLFFEQYQSYFQHHVVLTYGTPEYVRESKVTASVVERMLRKTAQTHVVVVIKCVVSIPKILIEWN